MRKTRKAHLWIGLIASILIVMESITGLLMNEPWLIGQSQTTGAGNFQPGQLNQGGTSSTSGQTMGQNNVPAQPNNQNQTSQSQSNGQSQSQTGSNSNGQMQGPGNGTPPGGTSSSSFISIIKGLHEGTIGTVNIKWLVDLAAVAMMLLTGTGIYLSWQELRAGKKRNKKIEDNLQSAQGN